MKKGLIEINAVHQNGFKQSAGLEFYISRTSDKAIYEAGGSNRSDKCFYIETIAFTLPWILVPITFINS